MNFDFEIAKKDLLDFLSIEGITGYEKNIANLVKRKLIDYGIPSKYIFLIKQIKKSLILLKLEI